MTHETVHTEEVPLLEALRAGDERAFADLVRRHRPAMLAVASMYARDRAVAEEIVQETWLAVLTGLDRFEGRSTLKTWIFRILTNRAKTRAVREGRTIPFSAVGSAGDAGGEPAVDPDRFLDANHSRWPGGWASPPQRWDELPEERLAARETLAQVREAIAALPPAQRAVIALRDVEGWSAPEVSELLEITDGNQRVLLHRARSKVRRALESHLEAA